MHYPFALDEIKTHAGECAAQGYSALNNRENELFNRHFKLPAKLFFPAKMESILLRFHSICCTIVPANNVLIKQQQQQLQDCIVCVCRLLPRNEQADTNRLTARPGLRQYLMDYPLYSTLLLLDMHIDDEEEQCWWAALLARIYLHQQSLPYAASLIFDRARDARPAFSVFSSTLPIEDLFYATCIEIQASLKLLSHAHEAFKKIIGLFATVKVPSGHSIFDAPNKLSRDYAEIDEEQLTLHSNVDINGEIQQQYIEIKPAGTLSEKAKQLKFRKGINGKKNAIRRANLGLPHSRHALTPLQLKQFIGHAMPELHDSSLPSIPAKDLPFIIIFWIELWLNKPFSAFSHIRLFNAGSTTLQTDDPGIYYAFDHAQYQHTHMFYKIETGLINGKLPELDKQRYYDSSMSSFLVHLTIPFPLQSLFNLYLRRIDSANRRKTTLQRLLKISDQDYSTWLSIKINGVSSVAHHRITRSNIRHTFHHFIQDSVPNADIALLQQEGTLQSFYINTDAENANYRLHSGWLDFINILGLDKQPCSTAESDRPLTPAHKNSQQAFGAGLCVTADYLTQITHFFKGEFNTMTGLSPLAVSPQLPRLSQCITLYLHLRTAIPTMIRPIVTPYPSMQHIAPNMGVMTIRDKDAHRNQERRLLFFDTQLKKLWRTLNQWYALQSFSKKEDHSLSFHDGLHWVNANKYNLADLMAQFNINLDANAYRQTGASLLLEALGTQFQQPIINTQMNHFDYEQSPLRPYSLLTINDLANAQQAHLTSLIEPFVDADNALLALLEKLIEKKYRVTYEL